jgi:uncharacterized Zn-finger protein
MRSSEYNYFDTLRNELEADELEKAQAIDEQTIAVEVQDKVMNDIENEAEESLRFAMEIDDKEEVESEVPAELKKNPFNCPICHKTFRLKCDLKRHVECVHETKANFNCQHCPMTFYQKGSLKSHVIRKHTFANDDTSNKQRPFECQICQKRFKTKQNLKGHQVAHSGEFFNQVPYNSI